MNELLVAGSAILLFAVYIIYRRFGRKSGNPPAIMDRKSNENTLFAGQSDDPIEALTSNVRLVDVDGQIKSDFPVEKHTEVVDILSECSTANKATVYSIILGFAEGDIDKLREGVKIANEVGDYRDLAQALMLRGPK